MRTRATLGTGLLVLLLAFAALGAQAQASEVDVTLSFSNLAELASDHYEGWLIIDGSPVSTGKFVVNAAGELENLEGNLQSTFRVPDVDLDQTTNFVLSIEPAVDPDPGPAAVKPLAGPLNAAKTSASLAPNLGVDLGTISGQYILATPSDGPNTNEEAGVWFLDPSGPSAALVLPDLSATEWEYEGWAVIQGTPVTTGKFDAPTPADKGAPHSGPLATPPFPGEDFLQNPPSGSGLIFPADLRGQTIVISIEPRGTADTDPGPFQFKPLKGDVPSGAAPGTLYSLTDQSSTLATGTVEIAAVPPGAVDMVLIGVAIAAVVAVIVIVVVILVRRQGRQGQG